MSKNRFFLPFGEDASLLKTNEEKSVYLDKYLSGIYMLIMGAVTVSPEGQKIEVFMENVVGNVQITEYI